MEKALRQPHIHEACPEKKPISAHKSCPPKQEVAGALYLPEQHSSDSEALSIQRAAPLPSWAAKKIQLSPKFSLAQAGPYSSFSMVVFVVLKPAWTSRFASSDSAGKHGIETKLWAHQCVKLKTLAPYKNCLTLQDFFLHIPVAPSSSRRTLVHTRCDISYWVRM